MTFDLEKHHRRSLRLKNRDYSLAGYYFVTICARNRENIFVDFCVADSCVGAGLTPTPKDINEIEQPRCSTDHPSILTDLIDLSPQGGLPPHKENNPCLVLTTAGKIIENNWRKIADQNVKTDAFVIMPNHIHGIIIIKSHCLHVGVGLAPTPDLSPTSNSGQPQGLPLHKENAPTPKLGSIIGAFKSRCALEYLKFIDDNNLNETGKIWQRNYYEHIIRDQKELYAIRNYIKSNPANWSKDEENPLNL